MSVRTGLYVVHIIGSICLFVMWFSIPLTILQSESVILRIFSIFPRDMGIQSFLISGDICLFFEDMGCVFFFK